MTTRLLYIVLTFLFTSCGMFSSKKKTGISLSFKQDVVVKKSNEQSSTFKKGSSLDIKNEPVYIQAAGHSSVLVVPIEQSNSTVDIRLPVLEKENFGETINAEINKDLDALLSSINKFHQSMGLKKYDQALNIVQEAKKNFPRVTILSMLEASCLFVMGQKAKAKTVLEENMAYVNQSEEAKAFYERIKGDLP